MAKPNPRGQNPKLLEQYQRAQVETASPTRLVVLLYDGAIRFCSLAVEAMEAKDREAKNTRLLQVQRILSELMSSLDRKAGGEISDNLLRIYTYMYEELVIANLKDRIAPVRQVLSLLLELRETWSEIDRQATQNVPASGSGAQSNVTLSAGAQSAAAMPRLGDQRA